MMHMHQNVNKCMFQKNVDKIKIENIVFGDRCNTFI